MAHIGRLSIGSWPITAITVTSAMTNASQARKWRWPGAQRSHRDFARDQFTVTRASKGPCQAVRRWCSTRRRR